ncbi:hypothetical protein T484DRAFT_1782996 [Baffinella frigidus]|nr:hypothetical protein T484DRAFT_1782996 [Cryptophyta sp. CCMP2293]
MNLLWWQDNADNAVRAIENGVSLFRCASGGTSGFVSPTGRILSQARSPMLRNS